MKELKLISKGDTDALLQKAADGKIVLWVALRPHSAKLLAYPCVEKPTRAQWTRKACRVPIAVATAQELMLFSDVEISTYLPYDPSEYDPSEHGAHEWEDHFWAMEEQQTVTRGQVYYKALDEAKGADVSAASNANDDPATNWMLRVQIEATELWRKLKGMNCRPTKNNIKGDLAKICREKNIQTDGGKPPSADYIQRHALRGWTPPTD